MIKEPPARLYADRWKLADEIARYMSLFSDERICFRWSPRAHQWVQLVHLLLDSMFAPSEHSPFDVAAQLNRHLGRYRLRDRYSYLAIVCDWILEGNVPGLPAEPAWPPSRLPGSGAGE
jgi:hypothetical protein